MKTKHEKQKWLIDVTPFFRLFVLFILGVPIISFAQNVTENSSRITKESDNKLINQYIQSKGAGIITFDASNIKQFWIDNSVISKKDSFEILLNAASNTSVPLKIQLANVNEVMDCNIEVIADTGDFSFSVLNDSSKVVSTSSQKDDFLNYKVVSAVLHLEDTKGAVFSLKFSSKKLSSVNVKNVILSFSDNKNSSFLVSPGTIAIAGNDVTGGGKKEIRGDNSFSVSGKRFEIFSKKKIFLSDKSLSNSVTIKNIGDKPTDIYFGYAPYTEKRQNINNRNNPYKSNKVLSVLSSEVNSNKIIVDSYPEWEKGCCLVLNAKDDLSDFPNFSFVDGTITEVKKIDDTHSEILLSKPIKTQIKTGTKIRVQSKPGNTYIYTNSKRLKPGEEITFSSSIKKDESFLQYSPKAFCRGTYYVVPLIVSLSVDPNSENTILISDFSVSF